MKRMHVQNQIELPATAFRWRFGSGAWRLTVVTKATFELKPNRCERVASPDVLRAADEHHDADPRRSLRASSDLVPLKPRMDVLVVGSAHAPAGQPVASLTARLMVGDLDKAIDVVADRFAGPDGSVRAGAPFLRMPLVYERAAGGPTTWNPVGVGRHGRDAGGAFRLPNLVGPGSPTDSVDVPPVGLGPIAGAWKPRADLLGAHATTWSHVSASPGLVVPDDIDLRYFNAAPADQQREGPVAQGLDVVLEHLSPLVPKLVTRLPDLRPLVIANVGGRHEKLPMRADTIVFEPDRSVCTITYRAVIPVRSGEEDADITIVDDLGVVAGALRGVSLNLDELAETPDVDGTAAGPGGHEQPTMPFQQRIQKLEALGARPQEKQAEGLPFGRSQPPPAAPPAGMRSSRPGHTLALSAEDLAPPPAVVRSTGALATDLPKPSYLKADGPPPSPPRAVSHAARAAEGGVTAASDAAADSASAPRAPPLEPRNAPAEAASPTQVDLLEVLWAADDVLDRAKQSKTLRTTVEKRSARRELVPLDASGKADGDRRWAELTRLLGSPGVIDEQRALETAWLDGAASAGAIRPDLLVATGEIALGLDPRTLLEALIAVVQPLARADNAVNEALESARAALENEWSSARTIDVVVAKLKEVVSRGQRESSWARFESNARRLVLERRAFDMRTLLGGEQIRTTLHFGPSHSGVVLYLPSALKDRLPLFERFPVRAAVEIHPSQDALEPQSFGLFAYALARRIPKPTAT
ncbi:MAG: DUF2169 domain-containing protein [Polyangiaceae bacterium]|nr:DUF2169 domain-containing protein [Polyangiaceae bacterium]